MRPRYARGPGGAGLGGAVGVVVSAAAVVAVVVALLAGPAAAFKATLPDTGRAFSPTPSASAAGTRSCDRSGDACHSVPAGRTGGPVGVSGVAVAEWLLVPAAALGLGLCLVWGRRR